MVRVRVRVRNTISVRALGIGLGFDALLKNLVILRGWGWPSVPGPFSYVISFGDKFGYCIKDEVSLNP